jgi:hypothetical protein
VEWVNKPFGRRGCAIIRPRLFCQHCLGMKHVIILGAGASASSGFPLGFELAERTSDATWIPNEIAKAIRNLSELRSEVQLDGAVSEGLGLIVNPYLKKLSKEFSLMRQCDFDSIDEFGRVARESEFKDSVQRIKLVLRIVLSLPIVSQGSAAQDGDYRRFVKMLFDKDYRLKDDIKVLTFNYDPALEYLLTQRLTARAEVTKAYTPQELLIRRDAIFSGLGSRDESSWRNKGMLQILKLHGAIVYPYSREQAGRRTQGEVTASELFESPLESLMNLFKISEQPPLLFPYEIVNREGSLVDRKEFTLQSLTPWTTSSYSLYDRFLEIWCEAQAAIAEADRVSFVGVSMHELLKPAFKFLFAKRFGDTPSIVANDSFQSRQFAEYIYDLTAAEGNPVNLIGHDGGSDPGYWGTFDDFINRGMKD